MQLDGVQFLRLNFLSIIVMGVRAWKATFGTHARSKRAMRHVPGYGHENPTITSQERIIQEA